MNANIKEKKQTYAFNIEDVDLELGVPAENRSDLTMTEGSYIGNYDKKDKNNKHYKSSIVYEHKFTRGEKLADMISSVVGSWPFVCVQSICLVFWLLMNIFMEKGWDQYPFILLNLMLSFQAAYTAPIIMMSQNRQGDIDRLKACDLHEKVDHIRMNQMMIMFDRIEEQNKKIDLLTRQIEILNKKLN